MFAPSCATLPSFLPSPPHGKGPNYTLLPVVMQFCIFSAFLETARMTRWKGNTSNQNKVLWEQLSWTTKKDQRERGRAQTAVVHLGLVMTIAGNERRNKSLGGSGARKRKESERSGQLSISSWGIGLTDNGFRSALRPNSATADSETEYSNIHIIFVEVEHANTGIYTTHRIQKHRTIYHWIHVGREAK